MKKNKPFGEVFFRSLKKTLKIMRIAIILLILGILQARATDAYSQKTRLSINFSNAELIDVLDKIEIESEFFFLYNEKLLDTERKVNISENDQFINVILDNLFADTDIKYAIFDRKIILAPGYLSTETYTQQRTITGTVTDENGSPMPGVNVQVEGTSIGTITSVDGKYLLNVPNDNVILVFSFIGYNTQKTSSAGKNIVDIQLYPDTRALEEVVVIGYGTVKKSDLTGSVTSVKKEQISLQAVSNPVLSLSGVTPGLQILQESGQPGATLNVRVRGENSLLGGNNPLYVVDGFPIAGDISTLNPSDIMSVEILKDASATAIYGSRGANGVILITTNKGAIGKTTIAYDGYYGIQQVSKTIDMLNARELAMLANVRAANDGLPPYFTEAQIASFGEGTNWQNEIFRLAPIQNHSLSVSGGNNKTTFNVSASYFNQEGIVINSSYDRLQARTSIEHKISQKWKVSLNSNFSNNVFNNVLSQNTERGLGVLSGALVAAPSINPRDEEGNYSNVRAYAFSPEISENPVAQALERKQLAKTNSLLSDVSVEGTLVKDLVFRSSVGLEYDVRRGDFYSPSIFQQTALGSAQVTYSEISHLVNENLLTYSKTYNINHDFRLMGGITSEINNSQYLSASSTGFLSDILENYSLQAGSSPGTPTSSYTKYSILSYLGRFNYSFMGKYLVTASMRADGSSRFGANNQWGYFPSAALAWRISNEQFLKDRFNFLSNLKLRTSWGKTGNTAVSPYQSLVILSSVQTVFDNSINIGYAPGSIMPNPNLKWETTTQIDAGVDAGFFDDRVLLTFDYYYKKTNDLLASVPVILSSGYSTQTTNLGSTENKGFEISIDSRITKGSISWNLGANISVNRNKVLQLSGGDIFGDNLGNALPAMSLVRVGYPIGVFYGYVEDGLTEEGKIKYLDLDNNGTINSLDRRIIGDPNPDFIFGINSNLTYRNFGLSILINGVQGNDILNYNLSNVANGMYFGENQIKDVWGNYWTQDNPNPNAKYPRISIHTQYLGSDRYIEDGSYIQLKNIKFSYTFRGGRFETSPFYNSEVYLNVQNLLTITKYSFFSPIINTRGGGISKGIDQWGYPESRAFMVGVRVNFKN